MSFINKYKIKQISLGDVRILALFNAYADLGVTYDASKYAELTYIKEHLLAEPSMKEWIKNSPVPEF